MALLLCTRWRHWLTDERGLTTVEYALALSLIAAAGVAAWSRFGVELQRDLGRANVTIRDCLTAGKEKP